MGPSLKDSLLSVGLFFQKLHAISSHLFESSPHNRNGHKERDKVAHGTDTGKSLSEFCSFAARLIETEKAVSLSRAP